MIAIIAVTLATWASPHVAGAFPTHCWGDTIAVTMNAQQTRIIEQHVVYRGCDHRARRRSYS